MKAMERNRSISEMLWKENEQHWKLEWEVRKKKQNEIQHKAWHLVICDFPGQVLVFSPK